MRESTQLLIFVGRDKELGGLSYHDNLSGVYFYYVHRKGCYVPNWFKLRQELRVVGHRKQSIFLSIIGDQARTSEVKNSSSRKTSRKGRDYPPEESL